MILLLDNYDSFTFIIKDYLEQCGQEVIVRENNGDFAEITALDFSSIVLSPGPKIPVLSGGLMPMVEHAAVNKIPTLGVCLGHQAIGEYFGGKLIKALRPMHGKVSTVRHSSHLLFENIPREFEACRYHSLVISALDATPLNSIAHSNENEVMALAHQWLPIWGVQFHPEAILTQYGIPLIKNWLLHCH